MDYVVTGETRKLLVFDEKNLIFKHTLRIVSFQTGYFQLPAVSLNRINNENGKSSIDSLKEDLVGYSFAWSSAFAVKSGNIIHSKNAKIKIITQQ